MNVFQQRRRRLQTYQPKNGSAEDSDDLRNSAQVSNLKFRDQGIYGLSKQVDLTDGQLRIYSLLDERIADQLSSKKYTYSVIRFRFLAENVRIILTRQKFGKRIASKISLKARNIDHIATSQENH